MVPLYTRLYPDDRSKLDALVEHFPEIPRKKIRANTPKTRKITDAEVIRIAISDSYEKRISKRKIQRQGRGSV